MNPLVIVGAVALIGFLATMRGGRAVAAPPVMPPPVMPSPVLPSPTVPLPPTAPMPILSAILNVETT